MDNRIRAMKAARAQKRQSHQEWAEEPEEIPDLTWPERKEIRAREKPQEERAETDESQVVSIYGEEDRRPGRQERQRHPAANSQGSETGMMEESEGSPFSRMPVRREEAPQGKSPEGETASGAELGKEEAAQEGAGVHHRRRRAARYENQEPEEEPAAAREENALDYGSATAREVANRYRQRQELSRVEDGGRTSVNGTVRMPASAGRSSREKVGYEPGRMGMSPAQRARMSEEGRARLAMENREGRGAREEYPDPRALGLAGKGSRNGSRPVITGQKNRSRKGLTIAVAALLVIGVLLAGILIIPEEGAGPLSSLKQGLSGLLGGDARKQNSVLSFTLTNQSGEAAPAQLVFDAVTDKNVVDVRILSDDGKILPTSSLTGGETPLNWTLTWNAQEAYEGNVSLEILESGGWKETNLQLPVRVLPGPDLSVEHPAGENPLGGEAGETDGNSGNVSGTEVTPEPGTEILPAEVPGTAEPAEDLQGVEAESGEAAGMEESAGTEPDQETPEDGAGADQGAPEDSVGAEQEVWAEDETPFIEEEKLPEENGEEPAPEEEPDPDEPEDAAEAELPGNLSGDADGVNQEETAGNLAENVPEEGAESAEAEPTEEPRKVLTVSAAESADPSLISTVVVYNGTKKVAEYARADSEKIHMPVLGEYTRQKQGILTFRTDAFRQNGAVGTVKGLNGLRLGWTAEAGSVKGSGQTYYGIGWVGQPAIVKWSKEVREQSDLYESKKEKSSLKEVIVAGLDGRIYFLDLTDGSPTRNSIKLGYPMKAAPSIHPGGAPYMTVGQFARKMAGKTGTIGLRQYNLYSMKELSLIDGLDAKNNRPYNKIGSFETSALIDRTSSSKVMVTAGSNGMLYLINLNSEFDYGAGVYNQSPTTVVMKSRAKGEKDASTAVEASVAMYDRYVYYADMGGYLRCVDTNTLKTAWAVALGDSVESTPALDWHGEDGLDLYTATLLSVRKKGDAEVKCFDALSGAERWTAAFSVKKDSKGRFVSGFRASPVVGQNGLSEYVYYTVNGLTEEGRGQLGLGEETSALIALRKDDGSVAWARGLSDLGYSSPVAVYDGEGNGALIQCTADGMVLMLDGLTGDEISALQIDGAIEACPAVYDGMMVVGTSERNKNNIYGIIIE